MPKSPHAQIIDPFSEKSGGFDYGNLAKTVLAGLGVNSAIDFFRKRITNDTKQDKLYEKKMRKQKELEKKLNKKGMTLDDVLRQMKKNRKK